MKDNDLINIFKFLQVLNTLRVGSDVVLLILPVFINGESETNSTHSVVLIRKSAPNINMGFHIQKLELRLRGGQSCFSDTNSRARQDKIVFAAEIG